MRRRRRTASDAVVVDGSQPTFRDRRTCHLRYAGPHNAEGLTGGVVVGGVDLDHARTVTHHRLAPMSRWSCSACGFTQLVGLLGAPLSHGTLLAHRSVLAGLGLGLGVDLGAEQYDE